MNTKLITLSAAIVGLLGFTSAQAEFSWYGSLRAGAVYGDPDTAGQSASWDLGATGKDGSIGGQGLYSRFGIKASNDLGNGASAGLRIERGISGYQGGDTFDARHTNVWIGGDWGKLTLGQQDNPYRSAAKWDQTWFLGGQRYYGDGGSRIEGINYSLSSGAFNLNVMATGNNGTTTTTRNVASDGNVSETVSANGSKSGVDRWIVTAGYDFGPVKLDVAYNTDNTVQQNGPLVNGGTDDNRISDNTVVGVNGSVIGFDWYLAYQVSYDSRTGDVASAGDVKAQDVESLGGFLSYAVSDIDKVYGYYVTHDEEYGNEKTETILGYSHNFGGGTSFHAEYLEQDTGAAAGAGGEPSVLALAVKVDF